MRVRSAAQAYAAEKADHLAAFNADSIFGNTPKQEQFRDALLDSQYVSPHNLQARMWKMALKDAYETVLKQWAVFTVDLRSRVKQQSGWSKAQRAEATIERQINTEINVVLKKHPAAIVAEKLDIRGKAQSRGMSRRVSGWVRGTVDERLDFKASARGYSRKHVNPAYSSQTCPTCGFLAKKNRNGDTFQCLNCGHRGVSDRVAAQNLLARWNART